MLGCLPCGIDAATPSILSSALRFLPELRLMHLPSTKMGQRNRDIAVAFWLWEDGPGMAFCVERIGGEMWLRSEAPVVTWGTVEQAKRYETRGDAKRAIARVAFTDKDHLRIVPAPADRPNSLEER